MNRVTFRHSIVPILIDISIVKSSTYDKTTRRFKTTYTTDESNVFDNPEVYEIEIEVDNLGLGLNKVIDSSSKLLSSLKLAIKYVLMGLQESNFPISYLEQKQILHQYMNLIYEDNYHSDKPIYPSNFIGPSSYTLQMENITLLNDNANIPNIRKNYTVTDKADGERHMMYISGNGKIYVINKNMKVIFTGSITQEKEVFDTLLDGEIVLHDKYGKYIQLYAAFDIYFHNKKDVRSNGFVPI